MAHSLAATGKTALCAVMFAATLEGGERVAVRHRVQRGGSSGPAGLPHSAASWISGVARSHGARHTTRCRNTSCRKSRLHDLVDRDREMSLLGGCVLISGLETTTSINDSGHYSPPFCMFWTRHCAPTKALAAQREPVQCSPRTGQSIQAIICWGQNFSIGRAGRRRRKPQWLHVQCGPHVFGEAKCFNQLLIGQNYW